jgi:hypothetical protein
MYKKPALVLILFICLLFLPSCQGKPNAPVESIPVFPSSTPAGYSKTTILDLCREGFLGDLPFSIGTPFFYAASCKMK